MTVPKNHHVYDVRDFGAVQDGVTDDTQALRDCIACVRDRGTVVIPADYPPMLITETITVDRSVSIVGAEQNRSRILYTGTADGLFRLAADDIRIADLCMESTTNQFEYSQQAITNVTDPATNLPFTNRVWIERNTIRNFGGPAINLWWYRDVFISHNLIEDVGTEAVGLYSVERGRVEHNSIRSISRISPGNANSFGISMSRRERDTLAEAPRCARIAVVGNIIEDVSDWTGIDTHGGEHITITGNTIFGCPTNGISVGSSDSSANNDGRFAPHHVSITGNVLDSRLEDGTANFGIAVTGGQVAAGGGGELAEGMVVSGNSVCGYGLQSALGGGGIGAHSTCGLVISGNAINRPSPHGIFLNFDNVGFSITGNTIVDAWSNAQVATGIFFRNPNHQGIVAGNSVRFHSMPQPDAGMYLRPLATGDIVDGGNDFCAAITPITDQGGANVIAPCP